ncbi:MAG: hypothetical protein J0H55_11995 [Chitinophagaceae bacterium]|nr:hypothetical protein [Chitinophagaceae bacterium]
MKTKDHFVIVLKNEKISTYKKLAFVFAGINLVPFVIFSFFKSLMLVGLLGVFCFIVYFVLKRYLKKKYSGRVAAIDEYLFFLLASVWLMKSVVMALSLLIIGLLFKFALKELKFVFKKEGIYKDFFPKKKYEWSDLDFIILKAGILTMNFKDEGLIQGPVENESENDEQEFNSFVLEQLHQK